MPLPSTGRATRLALLALCAPVFAACGGGGLDLGPDDDILLGETGGSARFTLQGVTVPTLPINACVAVAGIFTFTATQGKTEVDVIMLESAALREGRTLAESTAVGFRTAAPTSALAFDQYWVTERITTVSRNGSQLNISGFMTGMRVIESSSGSEPASEPIDGGAARPFTLTATCRG
jgi:hypothetical protein